MTNIQKAIKFAEKEIKSLELAPKINGCETTEWWKEQIEVWKTAISALEKQIPKKPYKDQYDFWCCPCCNESNYAIMYDSNIADAYNYCHNCGQALDWGDIK